MVEVQMLKLMLDTNVFLMFFRFFFYFFKTRQKDHFYNKNMAERMGFEPMKELLLYTLSKRAPSTARPPLLISIRNLIRYEKLFKVYKNL